MRSKCGLDFVCKVLVVGSDGKPGLLALRQALSGRSIFQAENHILPLLIEIPIDNILIGVFPMGSPLSISDALFDPFLREHCSLGDLLHMVGQGLEV